MCCALLLLRLFFFLIHYNGVFVFIVSSRKHNFILLSFWFGERNFQTLHHLNEAHLYAVHGFVVFFVSVILFLHSSLYSTRSVENSFYYLIAIRGRLIWLILLDNFCIYSNILWATYREKLPRYGFWNFAYTYEKEKRKKNIQDFAFAKCLCIVLKHALTYTYIHTHIVQ